jgi:HPt (histidine-containing phosphotransfer) domain-containing protein
MSTAPIFRSGFMNELVELLGDDASTIDAFFDSSLPDLTTQVDRVAEGASLDAQTLGKAAHSLKGGAGALGADEIRTLAAAIEQRARKGAFGDDVRADVVELNVAHKRFIKAVGERKYRT